MSVDTVIQAIFPPLAGVFQTNQHYTRCTLMTLIVVPPVVVRSCEKLSVAYTISINATQIICCILLGRMDQSAIPECREICKALLFSSNKPFAPPRRGQFS